MLSKIKLFALLLVFSLSVKAQVQEVSPPDYIKTIIFKGNTPESQLPILKLGDRLILEFDALNGDEEDYYYKIEHFNYDWTPSVLVKTEYLDGFDNQRIRNYENSLNTYQIYSNYKLTIPNQFIRGLKVSGNYLLSIYNSDDDLVFSRKFMIYEDIANVGVAIKRSRDVQFVQEKQSVDITISSGSIQFTNPSNTVKALIVQNNNLNTAITGLKPQYTLGNKLIYKYTSESSFWAGNEYFFFENKDVRASNNGIRSIDLQDLYHNYLYTNIPRLNNPYTYNPDINGNFLITALDVDDTSIEADYVWLFFSLRLEQLPKEKSIYIYGNFNNYTLDDATKMNYDSDHSVYAKALLLKQGFYNYKYVVLDEKGNLDEGAIGGNFYQTENNYKVIVYYRDLGARFDRIVGLGETNSVNISN